MRQTWINRSFLLYLCCFLRSTAALYGQVNITTWQSDLQHTGANLNEVILTPANVAAPGNFGLLFTQATDGQTYGQPLYVSAATLGQFADGSTHNVVYIATEHDSVYAFDADSNVGQSGAALWHASLLPSGTTPVSPGDVGSGDIGSEIGITTTPVIDPASSTLYVVSKVKTADRNFFQYLYALDLKTGAPKFGSPVLINPTFAGNSYDASNGVIPFSEHEHTRAAMMLYNGVVYISYGSHSDTTPYHGEILGYDATTLQLTKTFISTPNGQEGGFWGGGAGPAVDSQGNMFVSVANGAYDQQPSPYTTGTDWGESLLKLPTNTTGPIALPYANTLNWFTPASWNFLNGGDYDLGSGGILLLPDQAGGSHPHLLVTGGKGGTLYVVDRDNMGGLHTTDAAVQEITEHDGLMMFITPAYFNGNIYYSAAGGPLEQRAIGYDPGTGNYVAPIPITSTKTYNTGKGSGVFITANGNSNGIAWMLNGNGLDAYNAVNVSGAPIATVQSTIPVVNTSTQNTKFSLPIVVNGKAYFTAYDPATNTGYLFVSGLLGITGGAPSAPSNLQVSGASSTSTVLSWTDNSSNESGFAVLRATSASGPFVLAGSVGANITQFTDSGLNPQTTYFYEVQATNSSGNSSSSNLAAAVTFPLFTQTGLVAYWSLDAIGANNVVADITNHGNNGTANGETVFTLGGFINGAFNFHGTTVASNISVPNAPSLQFSVNQSFTLSAWANPANVDGVEQPIIAKSASQGNQYGIYINSGNNWVFRGPNGDLVGPPAVQGVWTNVAAVQDGVAGTRSFYVNGVLVATDVAQAADGAGPLVMGQASPVGGTLGYEGLIDEVRLYNIALPPSGITSLLGPPVLEAVSTQNHGTAGTFGLIVSPVAARVAEPRQGSVAGTYNIVLHFAAPVSPGITASLSLQSGAAATGSVNSITYDTSGTIVTIGLTGVGNVQALNLHVAGINPGNGTADVPFDILWGDVNGDHVVDSVDVGTVQSNFTTTVTLGTAIFDINVDGVVNSQDANLVSAASGTFLRPPAISVVSASGVTSTGATITWTTDQASSSQVAYGTTTGYGSLSALNSSPVTLHTVTLTGLTPLTTYNYAVMSTNAAGAATSTNFTFFTPQTVITSTITRVGGTGKNTGTLLTSSLLSIPYSSSGGNTVVIVCALGNTTSSITSIADNGSPWARRAFVTNGTAVRSEIWSTAAGASVASSSFNVNLVPGTPASCALEEYAGVLSLGATASAQATSGSMSVTITTQEANNFIVAGLGANSYYGYSATGGALRQVGGLTSNSGNNYAEMDLCDNTATTATAVTCSSVSGPAPWAVPALELRTVSGAVSIPVISAVTSSGVTGTGATITWTTDQASSSQVAYGTTTAYGSLSTLNSSPVTSHTATLTGLTPGTTYNYAVISTNTAGTATSTNFTFSTSATIPVISAVTSSAITGTGATITWTTDQASSSQVEYGTTIGYGSLSTLNASPVTSHTATLTGLTPGTTYNYAVMSTNTAGTATSTNFTFSTSATIPVISAVTSSAITGTGATITWTTDQASSSQVAYGMTIGYGSLSTLNASPVTSHTATLTGLTPGTTYNYAVMSTNTAGTATSTNFTFSTSATIPLISAVTSTGVTGTGATITWTTDQASSSQVAYGTTTGYGSLSTLNASPVTSHTATLTGLTPGMTYNYAVMSTNTAGTATSTNFTFSTSATIPVISAVTSTGVTGTGATITWTTDQASSSQVAYGTTTGYGLLSTLNASPVTSHTATLTGLTPGTTYNYAVMSTNTAGTATSTNFTFSTSATIPVISAVTSSAITGTGATITWTTDQASSSQVAYGTTAVYGSLSALIASPVTSHTMTLTGLSPGTTYNYAVMSTNTAGTATSTNFTFSTSATIPVISAVSAIGVTSTGATITWTTDQASSSQVAYGVTTGYGSLSTLNATPVTSHTAILTGLIPGVNYNYAVMSTNTAGTATSTNFTFSTAPTLPVISAVSASGVTSTVATITWTTDQVSNSQVEYGTTTAYGSLSTLNSSSVTSHTVSLTGLTPNTTYNYAAMSANGAGTATSANFTFTTSQAVVSSTITRVGGVAGNTGPPATPTTLAIPYPSSNGNTVVIVCALGNTTSAISSIVDNGSTWAQRAVATNPGEVRSEIWSTPAGGSVASNSFTINLTLGTPASCALEEYAGVLSLGATATAFATSSTMSVSVTTQDTNNFVVAGLGANSYYGYTATNGSIRQVGGLTSNSGNTYVEMDLCDNTAATASAIACSSVSGPAPWAIPALELRSVSGVVTIPVISSVTSSAITSAGAIISWTTDQPSSSQVAYGTTTGYGSLSALNPSPVTAHTMTLAGLLPSTSYNYAVISTDTAGTATSTNFTFTTSAAIPVISGVTSSGITGTSATITWATDQTSSSQVKYGTTAAYGSLSALNSSPVTSHIVSLTGLTPGTNYNYAVVSTNAAGTATSTNFTFSTSATIPVISAVTSSGVTGTGATITWTTDQASSSQVAYGTTAAYGSVSALNSSPVTSHTITLTGLSSSTTYNYAVISTNTAGTATSTNFTFSTSAAIPVISAVNASGVTSTGATITWTTDQASSTQVAYGNTTAYGSLSTLNSSPVTSHTVTLTGLTPGTTYNYAVMSTNTAGTATSTNFTFSTSATIPVISAVSSSSVTSTGATITWMTDQTSSSQMAYGTTTAYGSLSTLNSTPMTSHTVSLTGLTANTTYNYAVMSANGAGTATSTNFTFTTSQAVQTSTITRVGGAAKNTGPSSTPTVLSIPYSSSNGNTVVVVCALGITTSSISSIVDNGSTWARREFATNGTAVRSEIWSTAAGGSVASSSFTINLSPGTPASCALEEYAGVLSLGATASAQATSGTMSASIVLRDANNFVVAGLGANSYYGYTATNGALRQVGGLTNNAGSRYVEMDLCDNTAATATSVTCSSVSGPASWAIPALELRTAP